MPAAPIAPNESDRLIALRRAAILDTGPEAAYDGLIELAAYICRTPMSTVTFVDQNRQWFKAKLGIADSETPRDISFCAHAILDDKPLIVRDATRDERFASNSNVTGVPHIRFYAGVPLRDRENYALGTLCVMDSTPRDLDAGQLRALSILAGQAARHLELRQLASQLRDALSHVKVLSGLLPLCAWCKKVRDDHSYWNSVEAYLTTHLDAQITHGICPDCLARVENEQ